MDVKLGQAIITSQAIFKVLFPIIFIATSVLLILSIISNEAVFSAVNLIAIGSTCGSYYFAKHTK